MLGKKVHMGRCAAPGQITRGLGGNLHPWRGFKYLLDKAAADLL